MKKISGLLIAAILVNLSVTAQNMIDVHSKTGAVVSYMFTEKPVVTYENDVLVITTDSAKVEFPLADLVKITFDDIESNVDIIKTVGRSNDMTIYIYNAQGKKIKNIEASETMSIPELNLDELEKGVYIVKQGNITYKIVRK